MPINLFITSSTFAVIFWYFVALFVVAATRDKSARHRRIALGAALVMILLGYSNMFEQHADVWWLRLLKAGFVVSLVFLAIRYWEVSRRSTSDDNTQPPTQHENH